MIEIVKWISIAIVIYIVKCPREIEASSSTILARSVNSSIPLIFGFKVLGDTVRWSNENPPIPEIPIHVATRFEIFGVYLRNIESISFSLNTTYWTDSCDARRVTEAFPLTIIDEFTAQITVKIDAMLKPNFRFYFCSRIAANYSAPSDNGNVQPGGWIFQKSGPPGKMTFRTYEKKHLLPMWLQVSIIVVLFVLSGLFSGLNIGLMALNMTELKIIEKAGSNSERSYAKIIRPVRKRGNFLLCTLLLGNVLVNNTLAILMDDLTGSGLMAVIFSTIGIVILGEIVPQAICARHGLCIGAKTIWITKFFMVLTGVLSYPISKLLDVILGKELGQVYSRAKLDMLVKEQQLIGSVVKDEALIIAGALTLTTKTVKDIMTPLSDVFMISFNSVLDFDTMNEIVRNGFTRVPIYEGERSNIKAVLNVKDLAFIDPDDKIPVATVCSFYNRSILIVPDTTILRTMLNDFRQGRAHMAFVERLETECDGDPYRVMIGLVTLEDVIEEIIQAEIMDETDIFTDNVKKQRRLVCNQDFSVFNIPETGKYPRLSPQLKVAALRHLASNVKYFTGEYITIHVLQSLLNANIVIEHSFKSGSSGLDNVLYSSSKEANYAILILQGKANTEVSSERLLFEAGPFVLFGESLFKKVIENMPDTEVLLNSRFEISSMMSNVTKNCFFIPDFTLTAISNLQYLKITAKHYLFARLLSIWETSGMTDIYLNKTNPDQMGLSVTSSNTALSTESGPLKNKKSLTTSSLIMMRDFYQREWETYVEPVETGDTSINFDFNQIDEKSPLMDTERGDSKGLKPDKNGNGTPYRVINDQLSTSNNILNQC